MQSGLPVFMIETTGRESRDEIYLELRAYTVRVPPHTLDNGIALSSAYRV
jgi:hypothetical protein